MKYCDKKGERYGTTHGDAVTAVRLFGGADIALGGRGNDGRGDRKDSEEFGEGERGWENSERMVMV